MVKEIYVVDEKGHQWGLNKCLQECRLVLLGCNGSCTKAHSTIAPPHIDIMVHNIHLVT